MARERNGDVVRCVPVLTGARTGGGEEEEAQGEGETEKVGEGCCRVSLPLFLRRIRSGNEGTTVELLLLRVRSIRPAPADPPADGAVAVGKEERVAGAEVDRAASAGRRRVVW